VFYLYLKRLEIQGFKSFADRLQLDFKRGITSIVGPNGSGKSNIADAVRWVLGEQSAKILRGSKMEDVIFTGTEHRKPLGFAEVILTIDNSDKSLPLDFTEVTAARRVYRSGESEYFINNTPCRLKDIHELFMDTGIGRDGYSIIGQGRVDEILSSKSEERRLIFEEASGIMKYKMRKAEAEKKLELTEQNLLRINDIIIELENQLEPLRIQAEKAKKYFALRESLKELEINVFIENISKYKERLKEYNEQFEIVKKNIEDEKLKLEKITEENKEKMEASGLLEERLSNAISDYHNINNELEKSISSLKINSEKISNITQNIKRIEDEIAEYNNKLQLLESEREEKLKKKAHLEKNLKLYEEKLIECESRMESLLAYLSENERKIEELKTAVMDKLDVLSDKKTQMNNVKNHIANMEKRKHSIEAEIKQIKFDLDKERMEKEEISEALLKNKALSEESVSHISELNGQIINNNNNLEEIRKEQNKVKSELQMNTSRCKVLKDMEYNLEGYNRSVKMILKECRENKEFGRGIHGALAQLISVEKKYEIAIEMALGGALQNIVTTDEYDAKRAIEYLREKKIGRATFLPISSVSGKGFDENTLNKLKNEKGFLSIASELVKADKMFAGIINNLLGKVVVVENIDHGIKMARNYGHGFKIVTLEGDVLNAGGSMSGGSIGERAGGILSRGREIEELTEKIKFLSEEELQLEKQANDIIRIIENLENDVKKEQETLRNLEIKKVQDESRISQINVNIERLTAREDMLVQEIYQLSKQEKEASEELKKYEDEIASIENDISETKKIISENQERHKEDQTARDMLHRELTDYKISVNSVKESMDVVLQEIARIDKEYESVCKSIQRKNNEKNTGLSEIEKLETDNKTVEKTIRKFEEEKVGKNLEVDRLTEEKKVIEEELKELVNEIAQINKNLIVMQEEFNRIEVKKTKTETEMEQLQNRMWDEYELTYNNSLKYKKDIGSISQAQKQINDLREEIKSLGAVNVNAIDEYIKARERHEFMINQRNDMEQSKVKLHKIINEMTEIMKQQFIEQFKKINYNFNLVFKELFNGGHAELVLTDESNVLESGIDIHVQPPGKKLQNMMLLSGGERAFTAIALLFGILKLKPSPFCILDEIEAALDEANVYRFAEYLRHYCSQTQFIIITHRKGTMEMSDTLYGVTMQEHGVSKVVSIEMKENAS